MFLLTERNAGKILHFLSVFAKRVKVEKAKLCLLYAGNTMLVYIRRFIVFTLKQICVGSKIPVAMRPQLECLIVKTFF